MLKQITEFCKKNSSLLSNFWSKSMPDSPDILIPEQTKHKSEIEVIEQNTSAAQELNQRLIETQELIKNSLDKQLNEMKELFEKSMKLRLQNNDLQEEIKEWQKISVELFESLERMLEIPDDASKKIIKKVIKDFDRLNYRDRGLKRIDPSSGDDFNEKLHKFIGEEKSSDIEPGKVLECKKWGYEINGNLYKDKHAEVILAKAPDNSSSQISPVNEDDDKSSDGANSSTSAEQDSAELGDKAVKPKNENDDHGVDNPEKQSGTDSNTDN
ncbi:MAG: nucleotide exchange factor GrpE [Gloeotrichia echinulata GP01]